MVHGVVIPCMPDPQEKHPLSCRCEYYFNPMAPAGHPDADSLHFPHRFTRICDTPPTQRTVSGQDLAALQDNGIRKDTPEMCREWDGPVFSCNRADVGCRVEGEAGACPGKGKKDRAIFSANDPFRGSARRYPGYHKRTAKTPLSQRLPVLQHVRERSKRPGLRESHGRSDIRFPFPR